MATAAANTGELAARSTHHRSSWWSVALRFALAHIVAVLVAGTCMVTLPLVAFTALYVAAIAFAAVTDADPGGPLFFPFGAFAIVVVGGTCTFVVCAFGLTSDLLRRLARLPIWVTPPAAFALAFIASFALLLVSKTHPLTALGFALAIALVSLALFATYWLPLLAFELGASLLGRFVHFVRRRLRGGRDVSAASRSVVSTRESS